MLLLLFSGNQGKQHVDRLHSHKEESSIMASHQK